MWNKRSNNRTHTANMSIIPTSQRTDIVRWNIIAPEAVWEERRSREENWLHSAGWLIRVIKRKRTRLYCNHIDMGTIKFYIIMKTGPSLIHNQGLSCEIYSYLVLLYWYLIWHRLVFNMYIDQLCFKENNKQFKPLFILHT